MQVGGSKGLGKGGRGKGGRGSVSGKKNWNRAQSKMKSMSALQHVQKTSPPQENL